jgi:hypothetical protein
MLIRRQLMAGCAILGLMLGASPSSVRADQPTPIRSRIAAALENVITLDQPGKTGFATVWDGNKYVQCQRLPDHHLRCEAAGALMQPSLQHVLTTEKLSRLAALGWRLDPDFGNYAHSYPAGMPVNGIADSLLDTLAQAYDADLQNLEVESNWVASEPCPPRNGPSQNLAGSVNDAHAMAATAVHACFYTPPPGRDVAPTADLFGMYGARATGEIQRLRVNSGRRVFVALDTVFGYVQCEPETSPASIYCEAVSADSRPELASVLTPERLALLRAAGFKDPGRAPNYWKSYPLELFDDAAIARELLAILHDVYGYSGKPELRFITEKGGD